MSAFIRRSRIIRLFAGVVVVLSTTMTARADVVWQIIFLDPRTLAKIWWVIPLCLAIEFPVVRMITSASWLRCLLLTVFMNLISFGAGIYIQLPAMAAAGAFSRLAWLFILGAVGSTFIEGAVIKVFYWRKMTWPRLYPLGGVNALTTALSLAAVVYADYAAR